jgi:hypothetical protein
VVEGGKGEEGRGKMEEGRRKESRGDPRRRKEERRDKKISESHLYVRDPSRLPLDLELRERSRRKLTIPTFELKFAHP